MEQKAATTFQRVLMRNFIIQDVRKYLQSLCRKQGLCREHTNSSINSTVTKAFSEQVGRLYAQTITKAVLQRAKSLWKVVKVTGYASEDWRADTVRRAKNDSHTKCWRGDTKATSLLHCW